MELSWSTFILELVNFLVLAWILKRFLYRPVLDIVARRRAEIDATMSEARQVEAEAKSLQERYESRLGDWQKEQDEARAALAHELDSERSAKLAELRDSLDDEREKSRVAEEQRLADLRGDLEQQAFALAGRFAARLLEQAATPELQSKLVERLLADLDATPPAQLTKLLGNPDLPPDAVDVRSAYPLTAEQRDGIAARATTLVGAATPVHFDTDADLLAGVRMTIGACVLGLNLKDELDGFSKLSHDKRE